MLSVTLSKQLRDFELRTAFEAPGGGTLAIIGPTGCGKTMSLRMIAGLVQPDAGRITWRGEPLFDAAGGVNVPPWQRRVGFVFQDYAVFPHLTVLGNALYGCQARGMGAAQARSVALEALERVGLTDLKGELPRRLSGGQQQRVALARAIATQPELLLLDEPISALDASTRRLMRSHLKQVIAQLDLLTIMVTHDPVDALTLGDCVCVMHQGEVVQLGSRQELLTRPRSPFVAEFMGVNLLAGVASEGPQGMSAVTCGEGIVFLTTDVIRGEVLLTCNPWDIALSLTEPAGPALNVMRGTITAIAHLGARTRVTVENGVGLTAEIAHLGEEQLHLAEGMMVWASFAASAARVYK